MQAGCDESAADTPAPTEQKDLLRFLTCGSVDDGKSTLIGRLLYDAKLHTRTTSWRRCERDSRKYGTTGDDIDLALLVDGLEAEREQGITIDVAYRFFSTPRRAFIVADTPGHEQYTRNMATGASNSDAAVILIDARKGVLTQTRRHSYICSLLGIRHVIAGGQQDRPGGVLGRALRSHRGGLSRLRRRRSASPRSPRSRCRRATATTSPQRSHQMRWYDGPTLLAHLESIDVERDAARAAVPLPGAMGQSSESGFPRLFRHGRLRPDRSRAIAIVGRRLGQGIDGRAHRHRRRRPAGGQRRRCGDADLDGRGRHLARRCHRARRPRGPRSPISSRRTCCG